MKKRIGSSLLLWLMAMGLYLGSRGAEQEYRENSMTAVLAAESFVSGSDAALYPQAAPDRENGGAEADADALQESGGNADALQESGTGAGADVDVTAGIVPHLESGYVPYMGLYEAWRPDAEEMAASAMTETAEGTPVVAAIQPGDEPDAAEESDEDGGEYDDLAFADVSRYVNIRSAPDTDSKVVGKMYNGAVAHILSVAGENGDWFQIASGSVEGYIKAEFFIYGEAAADVVDEYVTRYAQVQTRRLNVRREPSMEAARIGYVDQGERVRILEDCGEWLRVQYTDQEEGYVAKEYVSIAEEFTYAISIEEEKAALAAQKALKEREQTTEQAAPEVIQDIVFPQTTYTSNEELRKAIIEYAMQYLGNRYVSGGKSLASGTDCSGFTCFIYADFGYGISRTPAGQLSSAGRSIDYSEIQPGDIICYSSKKGKACTHVALYIGDGQIIHAANSRKGVIISRADFEPIVGIKNVID